MILTVLFGQTGRRLRHSEHVAQVARRAEGKWLHIGKISAHRVDIRAVVSQFGVFARLEHPG